MMSLHELSMNLVKKCGHKKSIKNRFLGILIIAMSRRNSEKKLRDL